MSISTFVEDDLIQLELDKAELIAGEGRLDEALSLCQGILERNPGLVEGQALLGIILINAGQSDPGCQILEQALLSKPSQTKWLTVLCNGYLAQGKSEEALVSCLRMVEAEPDAMGHRLDLAAIHIQRGEVEAANVSLRRVIEAEPSNATAHAMLGKVLLTEGEYSSGWWEYAWQWRQDRTFDWVPKEFPLWLGAPMPEDKKLLILSDNGISETLQFARYISMVSDRCPNVMLACEPAAVSLLQNITGLRGCLGVGEVIDDVAAIVPISHLPGIFDTKIDSVPINIPYLKPTTTSTWKKTLTKEAVSKSRKVGFAWPDNLRIPGENIPMLPISLIRELTDVVDVTFVSFQSIVAGEGLEIPSNLIDMGSRIHDGSFSQVAGLVDALDLIITADTFIAHLAGALGKPVWLMIGKEADWRWGRQGDRTPWYPTMRIFRQTGPNWVMIFDEVSAALQAETRH